MCSYTAFRPAPEKKKYCAACHCRGNVPSAHRFVDGKDGKIYYVCSVCGDIWIGRK